MAVVKMAPNAFEHLDRKYRVWLFRCCPLIRFMYVSLIISIFETFIVFLLCAWPLMTSGGRWNREPMRSIVVTFVASIGHAISIGFAIWGIISVRPKLIIEYIVARVLFMLIIMWTLVIIFVDLFNPNDPFCNRRYSCDEPSQHSNKIADHGRSNPSADHETMTVAIGVLVACSIIAILVEVFKIVNCVLCYRYLNEKLAIMSGQRPPSSNSDVVSSGYI